MAPSDIYYTIRYKKYTTYKFKHGDDDNDVSKCLFKEMKFEI